MGAEWSCYMASLKEGEWSRGGQFSGKRMVMLQRWSV